MGLFSRRVTLPRRSRGAWRGLETGVDTVPRNDAMDANADLWGGIEPMPREPIRSGVPFAPGLPWYDAVEDPFAETGLFQTQNPLYPDPDQGARPIVGAYEAAFNTLGPVGQWGHEDQAMGRSMRFPINVPMRYAANGVQDNAFADELAAAIARGNYQLPSDADVNASLLMGI